MVKMLIPDGAINRTPVERLIGITEDEIADPTYSPEDKRRYTASGWTKMAWFLIERSAAVCLGDPPF